jgi:hypothetical protein
MEKLTKTITIGVTEKGRCAIKVSEDMDATLALQLTGTLALHLLNAFKEVAVRDIKNNSNLKGKDKDAAIAGITDSLYDAADSVFSNVLASFNPKHPRYTIEDEAILELVNKKIEDEYNKLPDETKVKYHEAYNALKLNTKNRATQKHEKSKED